MRKQFFLMFGLYLLTGSVLMLSSCKKDEDTNSVTDYDGNIYTTVTIGTQVWMVENLKTTHYNDGTAIANITDNTAWTTQTDGAYCWYNNDIANKATYGALYNWHAVNTDKLAPTGWHVPTSAEWETLVDYLGDEVAGDAMKATTTWNSSNTGVDNSSGFTAFAGGYRLYYDGAFDKVADCAMWWSSTVNNTYNAWDYFLWDGTPLVFNVINDKLTGNSVRCIQN